MAEDYFVPSAANDKENIDNLQVGKGFFQTMDDSLVHDIVEGNRKVKEDAQRAQDRSDAIKAKHLEQLEKEPPHSRIADNDIIAKAIQEHSQSITDATPDYYYNDIKKSAPAAAKMADATEKMNTIVKQSEARNAHERGYDKLVMAHPDNYRTDEWEAQKKLPYNELDPNIAPVPKLDLQKRLDAAFPTAIKNAVDMNSQLVPDKTGLINEVITATPNPTKVQHIKDVFLNNEDNKRELDYQMGIRGGKVENPAMLKAATVTTTDDKGNVVPVIDPETGKPKIDYNKAFDVAVDMGLPTAPHPIAVRPFVPSTDQIRAATGGTDVKNPASIVVTDDKNTGVKTMSFGGKGGYEVPVQMASGEAPVNTVASDINFTKDKQGNTHATALAFPTQYQDQAKTTLATVNVLDQSLKKAQEELAKGNATEQDVKNLQYAIQKEESKLSTYHPYRLPLDESVAQAAVRNKNINLTDKDLHSYFDKTASEKKDGVVFGYNPVEVKKSPADNGAGKGNGTQPSNKMITVTTQAQYDALPKGTKYIDSKGTQATKK